jgi:mannose-6-phosphate isomerase-like protein (cupin superfamily)
LIVDMAYSRIAFDTMAWVAGGHPLEQKKTHPESGTTLLRFEPGFADPHWCKRSHLLFVLEGSLELEFEAERVTLTTGQACTIEEGTAHRARNAGDTELVLLAVSDIAAQAPSLKPS